MTATTEMTYRQAIALAMMEEMERDPTVLLLGEDVGCFGGAMAASKGVFDKFGGKRVIDTPISEAAIIGAGLGAAITGLRPIVEIMFIDFTGVCMDQIANQVAKVRYMLGGQVSVPLVIRTQGGAGKSYAAQHSQSLEVWFAAVPGLKVVMPATPADAKGLLKSAIRSNDPVLFIEHKLLYGEKGQTPTDVEFLLPLGKAEVVRQGGDVTIVSYSRQLLMSLSAAQALAADGIDCEVIDLRTINPLDMTTILASLEKTGRLLVVEEGHKSFGVGAELSARVMEQGFDLLEGPVRRVATLDTPIPFSPVLEKAAIPNPDKIAAVVKDMLGATYAVHGPTVILSAAKDLVRNDTATEILRCAQDDRCSTGLRTVTAQHDARGESLMLTRVTMPSLSATMEEGMIVSWRVKEGHRIQTGGILAEIESDKSVFEYECPCEGVVRKVLVQEGQTCPVQATIAIIGEENEEIPAEWLAP